MKYDIVLSLLFLITNWKKKLNCRFKQRNKIVNVVSALSILRLNVKSAFCLKILNQILCVELGRQKCPCFKNEQTNKIPSKLAGHRRVLRDLF